MSPRVEFWLIIAVLALGTWLMRSLPIMLHGHVTLPTWVERLLRYVPVAAVTALVVPGVLYLKTNGHYDFSPPRLIAGVVALLVSLKTRNVVATLVVGMAALWAAQSLFGLLA